MIKKPKNTKEKLADTTEKKAVTKQQPDKLQIQLLETQLQLQQLKDSNELFRKEMNEKFLNKIEEKTKEAGVILEQTKQKLTQKLVEEFELKKQLSLESICTDLVNITSQLDVIVSSPTDNPVLKNYLIGFQLLMQQFDELFHKFHIFSIAPKVGDIFLSDQMSAVQVIESDDPNIHENGIIHKIFSKGYKLHQRVIKLCEVAVEIKKKK